MPQKEEPLLLLRYGYLLDYKNQSDVEYLFVDCGEEFNHSVEAFHDLQFNPGALIYVLQPFLLLLLLHDTLLVYLVTVSFLLL
ncbi:hypothetical protein HanPSC8_Chr10g0411321 [Helianthus annuus]|nr:hypothetical protein HanPSC8_Chr10g0411321 [Helianthus annuus]